MCIRDRDADLWNWLHEDIVRQRVKEGDLQPPTDEQCSTKRKIGQAGGIYKGNSVRTKRRRRQKAREAEEGDKKGGHKKGGHKVMEALVQTQLTKYFEAKNKESNEDLEDQIAEAEPKAVFSGDENNEELDEINEELEKQIAEEKMRTEYEAVYAEKTSSEQYLIQPQHLDRIKEVVKDLEALAKKAIFCIFLLFFHVFFDIACSIWWPGGVA